MKVRYCIPTLNQLDWVLENHLPSLDGSLLDSVHIHMSGLSNDEVYKLKAKALSANPELLGHTLIDTGTLQPGSLMRISTSETNYGVARIWNKFAEMSFADGMDYIVIANDDISLFNTTLKRLLQAASENPDGVVTFTGDNAFSLFVLSKQAWKTVGAFDEEFYPAYFEDRDYQRRIMMHKVPLVQIAHPAYYHLGSKTINSFTPDGLEIHHSQFRRNEAYYTHKWGGLPGDERYTEPFDGKTSF